MVSGTDAIDLRNAAGYVPAIPGTGMIDHAAFRAPDAEAVHAMRRALHERLG
jgi:phospholipase/carboxylesterase